MSFCVSIVYLTLSSRSCTKGNRLVVVASEYVLSKDIVPMFQVYSLDQDGLQVVHRPDLELRLRQPSEFEVRNAVMTRTEMMIMTRTVMMMMTMDGGRCGTQ